MKIAALVCILLIIVLALPCEAQDRPAQGAPAPKRAHDASASGMAYGAILISIIIMIALPSVLLLLIVRIVRIGIEETGLVRCVYTSLIFFAVVALVFYYFAEGLERGMADPGEFFKDNDLLVGLCIALGVAVLLMYFMLSGTILRSVIGAVLYVIGFYFCAYLAYNLIVASGAQEMFKKQVGG